MHPFTHPVQTIHYNLIRAVHFELE
uniref:Uncharacterized protein n=1 Tax=Anguilla anguilla TaxID=7936 RepID=A0A0E9S662_ANGAN